MSNWSAGFSHASKAVRTQPSTTAGSVVVGANAAANAASTPTRMPSARPEVLVQRAASAISSVGP
jgi:hypothetical protein